MRRLAWIGVALALAACSTNTDNGTTDVDAGSTAPNCGRNTAPCAPGGHCDGPPDCASNICRANVCNAPDPNANDTTDTGCGGPHSPACADGKKCMVADDCESAICTNGVCQAPSCTDGIRNGAESDVDCGGGTCPACDDGKKCKAGTDCKDGVCDPMANTCTAPSCMDGVQNQGEVDVDCGGPCGLCGDGKKCMDGTQCVDQVCKDLGMGLRCQPPACDDGLKNGDESDVDCGGAKCAGCGEGKACNVDTDCAGKGCNYAKKCVSAPSCKGQHGGDTCGTGEFGDAAAVHEDCCVSLPVTGYSDPNQPGKTVYLDKYEITAGRMRTFINAIAAANGGTPDVKGWMAAHRPTRWNNGWENPLPSQQLPGVMFSYTIATPTANLLTPGNDVFQANPHCSGLICNPTWAISNGNFAIDTAVVYTFMQSNMFPEFTSTIDGPDYAATHAMNCDLGHGSYGYPTYWFDNATVNQYTGGVGFYHTQDVYDEKALNCTPFGLFAAFCAWDGGQLATAEVSDFITGNTISPVYGGACERPTSGATQCQNGKLLPGESACGPGGNSYITYADGASPCYAYYYPPDPAPAMCANNACDYDGTARIAPPGRLPNDLIKLNAADADGWYDMIGNLHEAVMKAGETQRFDFRGYGNEYTSIDYHMTQETTARMKSAAFGARCMRFK